MEKIILFGASVRGKLAKKILDNKYEIVYFCDNDEAKQGEEIEGIPTINLEDLKSMNESTYDFVLITSQWIKEIYQSLRENKINNIKIFDYENKEIKKMITNDNLEFLRYYSEEFKGSAYLEIKETKNITREIYLQEIVRNKTILHVGCCDHLALIDKKIKEKNIYMPYLQKFHKNV